MARTPRLRACAVVFVALSGAAVPACQHFDGDASEKHREAAVRPAAAGTRVAAPHDPRLPPPPRSPA